MTSGTTALLLAGAPEPLPFEHLAQGGAPRAVRGEGRPDGGGPQMVHFWAQVRTKLPLRRKLYGKIGYSDLHG